MERNKIFLLLVLIILTILPCVLADDSYLVEVSDISPTILVPGEESTLTFEIENFGSEDVTEIIFSWEEQTGSILPLGSSNTKTIESIDEGDSEELKFNVFASASADPGLYELTLTTKFKTENGTIITETSKAGIIVGGTTDFEIIVSDFSSGEILLSVTNLGSNDANSVIISLPLQSGFDIGTTSSSIVGDLVKGDYSIVSFPLTGSGSSLTVNIEYTDTTGIRQSLSKQIAISQSSSSSSSVITTSTTQSSQSSENSNNLKLIFFIFAGISFIALIIIVISFYKSSRRKNENL